MRRTSADTIARRVHHGVDDVALDAGRHRRRSQHAAEFGVAADQARQVGQIAAGLSASEPALRATSKSAAAYRRAIDRALMS